MNRIALNAALPALGNRRFKNGISAILDKRIKRQRQRLRQRASQSG